MEYEIADATSSESLEKLVAEMIQEGWEPLGGVAIYTMNVARGVMGNLAANHFVQAMVKKGKK